jgi:hypothetical protein
LSEIVIEITNADQSLYRNYHFDIGVSIKAYVVRRFNWLDWLGWFNYPYAQVGKKVLDRLDLESF